jgi:hypothetical protein
MSTYKYTQQDLDHAQNNATSETWGQVKRLTGFGPAEVMQDQILALPVIGWLLERQENPRASLKVWWAKPMSEIQEFAESIEPADEAEEIVSEDDLPKK